MNGNLILPKSTAIYNCYVWSKGISRVGNVEATRKELFRRLSLQRSFKFLALVSRTFDESKFPSLNFSSFYVFCACIGCKISRLYLIYKYKTMKKIGEKRKILCLLSYITKTNKSKYIIF